MKKETIKDLINRKFIISYSPESADECTDWYDNSYENSIQQYKLIIDKIHEKTNKKIKLISNFNSFGKLNLIEKKKGMKGAFTKIEKEYQSNEEVIIEKKDGEHILSICNSYDNLFEHRIESVLCLLDNDCNDKFLIDYFSEHELNDFSEIIESKNIILIYFHDVGCDGNSIIVFYSESMDNIEQIIAK